MRTHTWALPCITVLATATLQLAPGAPSPAEAAEAPALTVTGGARMFPAYSPAVSRYAVHPALDGSVQVDVTGAAVPSVAPSPRGEVRVPSAVVTWTMCVCIGSCAVSSVTFS